MPDKEIDAAEQKWTDAQYAEAVKIETELAEVLGQGLTHEASHLFITAFMALQPLEKVTVGGLHDAALQVGLREVVRRVLDMRKGKAKSTGPKAKAKLAGKGLK